MSIFFPFQLFVFFYVLEQKQKEYSNRWICILILYLA